MIGLVFLHLLTTRTIWFSLGHKRNVSDGVVNGIGTLFSLDHKLYASDYDSVSDSVASENQPSGNKFWKKIARHPWKFFRFWFSPFRSSPEYPLPLGISNLIYKSDKVFGENLKGPLKISAKGKTRQVILRFQKAFTVGCYFRERRKTVLNNSRGSYHS